MALLLLLFTACLVTACLWGICCSYKTANDRRPLIYKLGNASRESGWAVDYFDLFDEVSFDAHYWRLLTFRDPWAIYPVGLQKLVGAA